MSKYVEFDSSGAREFFDKLEAAAHGGFRKELEKFVEGIGNEFLRIVEDEIIRRQVLDTRLLLASFHKGGTDNIWEIQEGGLVLEVGSSVEYAKYVNDGHWTNPKGVERRFVPGNWSGDKFIYDPSASGGMVLSQHFVDGKPYFDSALRIIDKMMPELVEPKLQEWIDSFF